MTAVLAAAAAGHFVTSYFPCLEGDRGSAADQCSVSMLANKSKSALGFVTLTQYIRYNNKILFYFIYMGACLGLIVN